MKTLTQRSLKHSAISSPTRLLYLSLALLLCSGMVRAVDATAPNAPGARVATGPETGHAQRLTHLDQVPDGLNSSDWASIRAAYEAGRHQVVATKGGWQA